MFSRVIFVVALLSVPHLGSGDQCNVLEKVAGDSVIKPAMASKSSKCLKAVEGHIKEELKASVTYIVMGSHFLSAQYFRPGVAHMFLKHAGEERQHAKALMDYLAMRGYPLSKDVVGPEIEPDSNWEASNKRVYDGLKVAFDIETRVRDAFRHIIKQCEDDTTVDNSAHIHENSDYHASDILTGEFLDEQHKGVREIAGHLKTLSRLLNQNGASEDAQSDWKSTFAEMEFDRSLSE